MRRRCRRRHQNLCRQVMCHDQVASRRRFWRGINRHQRSRRVRAFVRRSLVLPRKIRHSWAERECRIRFSWAGSRRHRSLRLRLISNRRLRDRHRKTRPSRAARKRRKRYRSGGFRRQPNRPSRSTSSRPSPGRRRKTRHARRGCRCRGPIPSGLRSGLLGLHRLSHRRRARSMSRRRQFRRRSNSRGR